LKKQFHSKVDVMQDDFVMTVKLNDLKLYKREKEEDQ